MWFAATLIRSSRAKSLPRMTPRFPRESRYRDIDVAGSIVSQPEPIRDELQEIFSYQMRLRAFDGLPAI